jgi:uncharacterized membrane protein YeiH
VIGTSVALGLHVHWFIATLMGVITAVFGGVIRDMLCNEVPLIFTGELTAQRRGPGPRIVALLRLGVGPALAGLVAMSLIIAIRLAAIQWRITLPRFVARR